MASFKGMIFFKGTFPPAYWGIETVAVNSDYPDEAHQTLTLRLWAATNSELPSSCYCTSVRH